MKVSKLNNQAVDETIAAIFNQIKKEDTGTKRVFLTALVEGTMTELSDHDLFGTQGWEYWAGLE